MEAWPEVSTITTVEDALRVRASLPRLRGGDPLQAYKWALACRIRAIRKAAAGPLPQSLVRQLIAAAGVLCPDCGLSMAPGQKRWPSVDHIVALANGGTNEPSNLRVICNRCNSRKAARA